VANQTTIAKDALIGQPNPTVSLHVVVNDSESAIDRLLMDVGEFVDEIHVVLAGAADDVARKIERRMVRYPWIDKTILRVSPASYPDLYLLDTRSTYLAGTSLDGEILEGPFSEHFLLADQGAARNIASKSSSCDWRLHLEPNDSVASPWEILSLVQLSSLSDADVTSTRCTRKHDVLSDATTWQAVLTRNLPNIVWTGKTYPTPTGHTSQINVEKLLSIVDRQQKKISDLDQNFKLLYHEARSRDWNVPAQHLERMILDSTWLAASSPLPTAWIAGPLFNHYSKIAGQEEEARVRLLAGEICESTNHPKEASAHYARLLELTSCPAIYFKLAKIAFQQGEWTSCIELYEAGHRASATEQAEGNVHLTKLETATLLLVAMSYNLLGNKARAQETIDEVSKANMNSPAVARVWKKIYEIPSEETR
jgi:tetratricopeptide (TPR) repeat protein